MPDFSQWSNPAIYIGGADHRHRGVARDAAQPGGGRQARSRAAHLTAQPRVAGPGRRQHRRGIARRHPDHIGDRPQLGQHRRRRPRTKLSAIVHGLLLLVCVALFPAWLNMIPLSCLAAILLVTGYQAGQPRAGPRDVARRAATSSSRSWLTVVAIVLTDLLIGALIGLAMSIGFILNSNVRRPVRRLSRSTWAATCCTSSWPNQVSFPQPRGAGQSRSTSVPRGGQVLLDAAAAPTTSIPTCSS